MRFFYYPIIVPMATGSGQVSPEETAVALGVCLVMVLVAALLLAWDYWN